jgi:hypothetical protein
LTGLIYQHKAYGVPNLQLDRLVGSRYDFRAELDSNSGIVIKLEFFLEKLKQHATFPHAWHKSKFTRITNDNVLEKVTVRTHDYLWIE